MEAVDENAMDDSLKVYVSRIPSVWDEESLQNHFEACFGSVKGVSIVVGRRQGFGFVEFLNEAAKIKALDQKTIHAKRKNIRTSAVERTTENEIDNASVGICFLWQRNQCVKGDSCKFKHDGPGSCITVSQPGEGKTKKCLSFKSKGKCCKGDACEFLHIYHKKNEVEDTQTNICVDINGKTDNSKKLCNKFKKGKCRKGDKCIFSHIISERSIPIIDHDSSTKRKITGAYLVEQRKKLKLQNINVE